MIKIKFDPQIFGWQKYGGISRLFVENALFLSNIAHVSIDAPLYQNEYLYENINNLEIKGKFSRNLKKYNPWLVQLYNQYNFNSKNCEILHETYYSFYGKKLSINTCRFITVFDMIHEIFPNYTSKFNPTIHAKNYSVRRADKVITISYSTKKDLLKYLNIDEQKVHVIYPSSNLKNVTIKKQIKNKFLKNIKSWRKFPIRALYVGHRFNHKNFKKFVLGLSNIKFLKDFSLLIFGGSNLTKKEKTFLSEKKINYQAISGSDQELKLAYQNATFFSFPSTYEGFGIPIVEAMSLGCPVICGSNSSMGEVAQNACLTIDMTSEYQIKEAVELLVLNTKYREKLISLGLDRSKDFTPEKISKDLLALYLKK
tara:strand:- start:555 stop:1661 length:1107 start_codon:yes stop_codon:yes gene_type:complete